MARNHARSFLIKAVTKNGAKPLPLYIAPLRQLVSGRFTNYWVGLFTPGELSIAAKISAQKCKFVLLKKRNCDFTISAWAGAPAART